MLKLVINIITIVTLLLSFPVSGWGQMGRTPSLSIQAANLPAGIRLLHADYSSVVVDLNVPVYELVDVSRNQENMQSISIEGAGKTSEIGKPELPVYSALIGIPAEAEVTIQVLATVSEPLLGRYQIAPVPRAEALQPDAESGSYGYAPEEAAYAEDILYPSAPAKIAADAWLRDQRIVRIELYPFQYNPLQGYLVWNRQITAQVQFTAGANPGTHLGAGGNKVSAFDPILKDLIVNYDVARAWQGIPTDAIKAPDLPGKDSSAVAYDPPFRGPRYQIVVDHDALYRVTYEELQAQQPLADDDPNTFHMYNQGRDVAIQVADGGDGVFNSGDAIYFYGEQFRGAYMASWYAAESDQWMTFTQQLTDGTLVPWHPEFDHFMLEKYTDQNIYWLTVGGTGGPRMAVANGDPSGSTDPIPATYQATIRAEQELRQWEHSFTTTDSWYWEYVTDRNTHIYTTTLTGIAPGVFTATIRAEMASYAYNANYSPDHHTRFTLNNRVTPIDDAYWDGKSRYRFEEQIPQTDLLAGVNQLRFTNLSDAYVYPFIAFDFFEIDYTRLFLAVQNQLFFKGDIAGTWRYQADGFTTSSIYVLDITNPVLPIRITNPAIAAVGETYSATYLVSHAADEKYFISGGYESADALAYYQPPNFEALTSGVDYLFITHADFVTATQPLADFWTSRGLTTMIVDVDDLYAEFNEGIFHSIAIKNFIAYAFGHWSTPPTYVLLVGDGNWHMKNTSADRYGYTTVYMPPHLSWVDPWLGQTDSPNLLAAVVGDDILPDVLIGRLPVASSTELEAIVAKISAYALSPQESWQRNLLFIADDTPDQAGDFVSQSEEIIAEFVRPGYEALRIYLDDYKDHGLCGVRPFPYGPTCTPVNRAITETLSTTGTLLVNYTGHGSVQYWTGDKILLYQVENPSVPNDYAIDDVASMENGDMLPVVLSMTCWDGYWFYPIAHASQPSLSEVWLRTAGRGAVAVFSSDGLGVESGHIILQEGFYQAVFDNGIWNLGLATLAGKLQLFGYDTSLDLINTYIIFGDPALNILNDYRVGLSPESREGTAAPGESVTYAFAVTNLGLVTDTVSLQVTHNIWPADFPAVVGPLPAGESQVVNVTVSIPADEEGGITENATIKITSLGNRSQTDTAVLSTHSQPLYGVQVVPASASQYNPPGGQALYNLQVTNTGNITDSFVVVLGDSDWPVNAPAYIGPAGRDEAVVLPVTVDIPVGSEDWDADTVTVYVFSQSDSSKMATAQLTTVARNYGASIAPPFSSLEGAQGTTVTYTLQVDNTGGYLDTFTITVASEWPTRVMPESIGPLNAGQSASLEVAVDIPTGLPGGAYDEAVVSATSWGDPARTGEATLRTVGNIYGLLVRPAYAAQVALPGTKVTYSLQITNTSNVSDTFDVSMGGHDWPMALSDAELGPLAADGGSASITVSVDIPPSAQEWEADTVVLTVSSQTVPQRAAIATLDTTARLFGVMVKPMAIAGAGLPGTNIAYPLTVTNAGGFQDTFTVTATGGWPVEVNMPQLGPLDADQAVRITVTVSIPEDAGNATAVTEIEVISWGNPQVSAQAVVTTTSKVFGVALDPGALSLLGAPGEEVVFQLQVTNTSDFADTFTIQVDSLWPYEVDPVWIGPLQAHHAVTLTVVVTVPQEAVRGSHEVTRVVVTSLADNQRHAVALLNTFVAWSSLYVPLVQK